MDKFHFEKGFVTFLTTLISILFYMESDYCVMACAYCKINFQKNPNNPIFHLYKVLKTIFNHLSSCSILKCQATYQTNKKEREIEQIT